jgi:hypothetical protein
MNLEQPETEFLRADADGDDVLHEGSDPAVASGPLETGGSTRKVEEMDPEQSTRPRKRARAMASGQDEAIESEPDSPGGSEAASDPAWQPTDVVLVETVTDLLPLREHAYSAAQLAPSLLRTLTAAIHNVHPGIVQPVPGERTALSASLQMWAPGGGFCPQKENPHPDRVDAGAGQLRFAHVESHYRPSSLWLAEGAYVFKDSIHPDLWHGMRILGSGDMLCFLTNSPARVAFKVTDPHVRRSTASGPDVYRVRWTPVRRGPNTAYPTFNERKVSFANDPSALLGMSGEDVYKELGVPLDCSEGGHTQLRRFLRSLNLALYGARKGRGGRVYVFGDRPSQERSEE